MKKMEKFQVYPMDDNAVITEDFFSMPLIDGSEDYEYDEDEMAKSVEKARLARESCRKIEREKLLKV